MGEENSIAQELELFGNWRDQVIGVGAFGAAGQELRLYRSHRGKLASMNSSTPNE